MAFVGQVCFDCLRRGTSALCCEVLSKDGMFTKRNSAPMVYARVTPVAMRDPGIGEEDSDDGRRLFLALTSLIGVTDIIYATYRRELEDAACYSVADLDWPKFTKAYQDKVKSPRPRTLIRIFCVEVENLMASFDAIKGIGLEYAGDNLAGRFCGKHGILRADIAIRTLLLVPPGVEGYRAEWQDVERLIVELTERTGRLSPERSIVVRREVNRVKDRLGRLRRVSLNLTDACKYVNQGALGNSVGRDVVAYIAAAELGYKITGDIWMADLASKLSGKKPSDCSLRLPSRLSREFRCDLLPYIGKRGNQRLEGFPTLDRWVKSVRSDVAGMESLGWYELTEAPEEGTVVIREFDELKELKTVSLTALCDLADVSSGIDKETSTLYRQLKNCASGCCPPEGRCSSDAWFATVSRWKEKRPALLSECIDGRVSVRTIVAIYAGARGYQSFCSGIAERVLGTVGEGTSIGLTQGSVQVCMGQGKMWLAAESGPPKIKGDRLGTWLAGYMRNIAIDRQLVAEGCLAVSEDQVGLANLIAKPDFTGKYGWCNVHNLWGEECASVLGLGAASAPTTVG